MSTNQVQAQKLNIFKMCGDIDLCLRKMKIRNIFIVGLSRSGKSTLFNNINNVTLMGVAPTGSQDFELLGIGDIQTEYKVLIQNAQKANANSGLASVTLYPNILDKGEYTLSDMAGYMDTRGYAEVVGVSYVLKAAFQKVKECQFALVVMSDYFRIPNELFRSLKGFLKMFNFSEMSPETKLRLFQSMTFVITKTKAGAPAGAYASLIKKMIPQINNPTYGGLDDSLALSQILTYLSQHPEQYYLFEAAVINQKAIPSTIVQDHFEKRTYFKLQQQNIEFHKQKNKDIINLPFKEDFDKMPIATDKAALKADLDGKIETVPVIAKILQKFFKKAIIAQNLLDDQLSFRNEFCQMEQFNNRNDVYSKEFNNRCEGIEPQNFPTIFSPHDPPRPLKTGIILAQNAFSLYKLFSQWPTYHHEDSKFQKFMDDYRDHLVEIIKLFRNSFCSTYHEQQVILKFLFIAARICRQFSMLYQIRTEGKDEMCLKMKDSFQSIMEVQSFKEINKRFVIQLFNNLQKVCQKIEENREQAKKYAQYLNEVPKEDLCAQIQDMDQYKVTKRKILQIIGKKAETPHEALICLFDNFIEHKKTAQQYINKMNDDEEESYPEDINFKFTHLLSEMGHKILSLERADSYAEDLFAYDRKVRNKDRKENGSIRVKLIIQQASIAMDIFIYINDVESVCRAYEVILKNIEEKDYNSQVKYLRGLALYCSKNGRIQQSIILYQKALSICATGNLCKEFHEIKNLISEVENNKNERNKNYFAQLKHKKIIDPTDDSQLDRITDDIQSLFVTPYKNRLQMAMNQ